MARQKLLKKHLLKTAIFHLLELKAARNGAAENIDEVDEASEFVEAAKTQAPVVEQQARTQPEIVFEAKKTFFSRKKIKNIRTAFSFSNSSLYELLSSYVYSFVLVFKRYKIPAFSVLLIAAGIFFSTQMVFEQIFKDLPEPEQLTRRDPAVTTKITDRNGKVLFRLYEDENRTLIPLSEMPAPVVYATIAIEDKDFFGHHGFSIRGIARAIVANTKNETIQGGSTLTQQLVKNRLLSTERTYTRKLRELLLAVMTEQRYSKEEILEMYLNQIGYGGSTYGIEEAAQRYFGKSAKKLTLAEAAMLAGLPQAPSTYSPYGLQPELAFKRQEEVLRRMFEDGYITAEQAENALKQPLEFSKDAISIEAPHFVMYVRQLLADQYGEEMLQNGGLIVRTSLDLALQNEAQRVVVEELNSLSKLRITNGAALITNPQTGEVLSMVGSKNYFDFENDGQVNVTLRPRQPGSSIKPLTYALALENGFTPLTTIDDSPVTYRFDRAPDYSPVNYDGRFHGNVTVREALASSYNIPAVKTLNALGVNNMIDKAEQMGITTWKDRKRFGLSLTLGGGEVLMTDMATAYGVFATGGYRTDLNPILEVSNYRGEILYRNECALDGKNCQREQVLNPGVAYQITSILSDNDARTPAFGPQSTLHIPGQEVAVKTGTTNNLRDNWTIGYTSNRVAAVWVGNNDNTPMSYVASGITGASPIWNQLIRLQLSDEQPHTFAMPPEAVKVSICTFTKKVSCSWCRSTRDEIFLLGEVPEDNCRNQPIRESLSAHRPTP